MNANHFLYLERPTFWTETRDPESWFRALGTFEVTAAQVPQTGTPRAVADRTLSGVIARRGALGLFGMVARAGHSLLPGVGLLACDTEGRWELADEARLMLRTWQADATGAFQHLAAYLVRESPWLRLLLLRLHREDWALARWAEVRSGRGGLKVGQSLILRKHTEPESWFEGQEHPAADRWLARAGRADLAYDPQVLVRPKRRDNLSLTPLTAPLNLLESVGWLSRTGQLNLPGFLMEDLLGRATPSQILADLTDHHADVAGYIAVEPILRELLATYGMCPAPEAFAAWMDALLERSLAVGALELLDAQPGQSRHGRGLQADPTRKLLRWVIHPEFDEAFRVAMTLLDNTWEPAR